MEDFVVNLYKKGYSIDLIIELVKKNIKVNKLVDKFNNLDYKFAVSNKAN